MGKNLESVQSDNPAYQKPAGHVKSFVRGDIWTKLSAFIMGLRCFARKQIVRGCIFLAFEGLFIWYMITRGAYWISMLPSLGKQGPTKELVKVLGRTTEQVTYHDNSFKILLYGILTVFLIGAFLFTWALNIKAGYDAQEKEACGKKVNKFKDDLRSLVDENFYKTLLTLPAIGITVFTFMPIVFMILIAFTNFDGAHDGYITSLFHWVGFENFKTMFSLTNGSASSGETGILRELFQVRSVEQLKQWFEAFKYIFVRSYVGTFLRVLGWTLIWAFIATFSNYIFGILVALMINKKGIKLKKMWRTIFVMTIAIPQFISLLYVAKLFDKDGLVNALLMNWGVISKAVDFWGNPTSARILVLVLNLWVGIPYLMLIATGILMNIPQDLYEAARIDGANPFQQFRYITMPYMLFLTAPY